MKIQKPLLAGKFDSEKAKFPYAATPKIDGIRFLMVGGAALTRSFKPIRNEYLQKILTSNLPDGIDGELTSGSTFQECSSIMRIKGEPDFSDFKGHTKGSWKYDRKENTLTYKIKERYSPPKEENLKAATNLAKEFGGEVIKN